MTIGQNVRINSGTGNYVGGETRFSAWVCRNGRFSIHDGCALSNSTIIATESVEILAETYIGGGCLIVDSDLHALDAGERVRGGSGSSHPVRIGPRAFLGARVIVLKGAQIGEGAVIGAGSVVHGEVPAGELWAGAPARRIKVLLKPADASGTSKKGAA